MINKKIVCVGGGTGVSTLLRGLKRYVDPTAIVTMADSGGHSGRLRDELGVLPPGDVRACLVALADDDKVPLLRDLFNYRFENGSYSGASVGNLLLAALNNILGDFNQAVDAAHILLDIKGRVVPVTLESTDLLAELEDGTILFGEKAIDLPRHNSHLRIQRIWLQPNVEVNPVAKDAIINADVIVLGPGDLYTSILPNLYVGGVVSALNYSSAKIMYVANIMTKHGETDGFTVENFVTLIESTINRSIDRVIYNTDTIPSDLLDRYHQEMADPVKPTSEHEKWVGSSLLSTASGLARHDSEKLADVLIRLL